MERFTVKGWSQDPAWLSHKLTAVVVAQARSEDRDKGWEVLSSRCAIASTASNNRHESPQPPITDLGGAHQLLLLPAGMFSTGGFWRDCCGILA